MATTIRITFNNAEFRRILKSAGVRAELSRRMARVLQQAKASAPVGGGTDEHAGTYRDSLEQRSITSDRAVEIVASDVPYAMIVEARHGTLARALDAAR
jgi:LDH2 family malate/lactate/ureidoglycolate dehydrogenase